MSLPYPHDRARKRREDGQQPFKDAREDYGEFEAELDRDASRGDGFHETESEEERRAWQEAEASARFGDIGNEVAHNHESS